MNEDKDKLSPTLSLYIEDAKAIDGLFRDALQKRGSEAFTDFLTFLARFQRYSLFNAMLVRVQRPGALAVAPRRRWLQHGRTVRPDAVPIVILQPFGPVEFVYELGDTDGRPVPGYDSFNVFDAGGRARSGSWDRSIEEARRCSIAVECVANYGSGLAGTAAVTESHHGHGHTEPADGSIRYRVRINGSLSDAGRFATLAHELGHIYCGHLGGHPKGQWPDRRSVLDHRHRELEAEAAAWLVCRRAGIEPRSADYLASHVEDADDLVRVSPFAIVAAANRIEARGRRKRLD